jgi:uncharacterized membrane protein
MARNKGEEFATMHEDERDRFTGAGGEQDEGGTLAFDDPRKADRMGRHYAEPGDEVADPEHRDGTAAELDDESHQRAVDAERRDLAQVPHRVMEKVTTMASRIGSSSGVNVGRNERIVSGLAGAALVAYGLRDRRLRALLLPLGGGLIARGVTGRCPVNRAIGRNSARQEDASSAVASVGRGEGVKVEKSVIIDRPAHELYAFWHDFENLPRFMEHLESVTVIDPRRSHWIAKAPVGQRVEWDAEIHNEIPDRLIAWRSLPGSEIPNAGSVHFGHVADGATEVRVVLSYEPPAGRVGDAVARLFGEAPAQQVADDLRRFKQVMEAGEVPQRA